MSLASEVRTLSDLLRAFSLYGRVQGYSPQTLKTYRVAFTDLMDFLGDVPVEKVTAERVQAWIDFRLETLSKTTINIRLKHIRAAFAWLHREGRLPHHPLAEVKMLRVPRKYPKCLTDVEVFALVEQARHEARTGGWRGKRTYVLFLCALDAMLRRSEICNLNLEDIDWQNRVLRVQEAKWNRSRLVPMSPTLQRALREWLVERGHIEGEPAVFVGCNGFRIDPRNLSRILWRLGQRAKVKTPISPHLLRHTGATLAVRHGMPLPVLQQILGHSSVRTTEVYLHVSGSHLQQWASRAAPVDRLLRGR